MVAHILLTLILLFTWIPSHAGKLRRMPPDCEVRSNQARSGFESNYGEAEKRYDRSLELYEAYQDRLPAGDSNMAREFNDARNLFSRNWRSAERHGKKVINSMCIAQPKKQMLIRNLKKIRRMDIHLRSLFIDDGRPSHYFQNYR